MLDKWDETSRDQDALQVLHTLKGDSWQVAKLRTYLAGPAVGGHNTYTIRTTRHDTEHLFGTLRTHLRSHRLRAVVIRNHHGHPVPSAARHGATPQAAATAPLPPLSPGLMAARGTQKQMPPAGQVGVARAPANIADWSTTRRLDALLEDTLPLLGQELKAHLDALMTGESLLRLTAGFALMAGLQAIPGVGEAMDAFFLGLAYWNAGWDGLRAVALLAGAIIRAVKAQHEADIAGAAPDAARALNLLGSAFLGRGDPAHGQAQHQRWRRGCWLRGGRAGSCSPDGRSEPRPGRRQKEFSYTSNYNTKWAHKSRRQADWNSVRRENLPSGRSFSSRDNIQRASWQYCCKP